MDTLYLIPGGMNEKVSDKQPQSGKHRHCFDYNFAFHCNQIEKKKKKENEMNAAT